MIKNDALADIRRAVVELVDCQGTTLNRFRTANAHLAVAQLNAASAGASSHEISTASEWDGIPV